MPVTMKPTSVIKARLGLEPNGKVQKFFTNTCAKHMDKYVPFDTGSLAKTAWNGENPGRGVGTDTITYQQLYARYMYYGKKMVMPENGKSAFYDPDYGFWSIKGGKKIVTDIDLKYNDDKHPEAGAYWDKRMVSAEIDKVVKEVQDFVDRGGK